MLLFPALSSSSKVVIRRLLCVLAHWTYGSRWFLSQVSPVEIEQSWMSSQRLGIDPGDGGQLGEVGREGRERLVVRRRYVAEVHPRAVLTRVAAGAGRAHGRAGRGQALRVSREGQPLGDQLGTFVGGTERVRARVVGDALVGPGEQVEVVRLAGVLNGEGVGEVRAASRQLVEIRRTRVSDDGTGRGVLEHHDHHVVRPWHGRGCDGGRLGRGGRLRRGVRGGEGGQAGQKPQAGQQ